MLYYERIGISEGTYVNKTSASKGCSFCYYWYFLDKGLKFQVYVCNGYHDLLMMTLAILLFAVMIIVVILMKLAKVTL